MCKVPTGTWTSIQKDDMLYICLGADDNCHQVDQLCMLQGLSGDNLSFLALSTLSQVSAPCSFLAAIMKIPWPDLSGLQAKYETCKVLTGTDHSVIPASHQSDLMRMKKRLIHTTVNFRTSPEGKLSLVLSTISQVLALHLLLAGITMILLARFDRVLSQVRDLHSSHWHLSNCSVIPASHRSDLPRVEKKLASSREPQAPSPSWKMINPALCHF